jgi:DNA-directed RNA polymerase subunit M/transcription elongation factor TFIIS
MADVIHCSQCQSPLRVRAEYAGKKVKCPKCAAIIEVQAAPVEQAEPTAPPELPSVVAVGSDIRATAPPPLPVRSEAVEEGPPRPARPRGREPDGDDDRPERDERRPRRLSFKPCPRCGASGATRVTWTPWGSFYGPAMFNHVRCPDCGYKYNGRTGRSNLIPAIIFVLVPAILITAILGALL